MSKILVALSIANQTQNDETYKVWFTYNLWALFPKCSVGCSLVFSNHLFLQLLLSPPGLSPDTIPLELFSQLLLLKAVEWPLSGKVSLNLTIGVLIAPPGLPTADDKKWSVKNRISESFLLYELGLDGGERNKSGKAD